ncbi:MAG TPA: hypothetical protein VNC41_18660 [Acidimicrobiia bacterium]|nr:hypothetical protein [Acidimicrobiia bacterium]
MIRGRVALLLAALLLGASYPIVADPAASYAGPTTTISAPKVRSERAVLAPVTESRTVPMAAVLGVLVPAAVVAAGLAGTFLRRLPSSRRCRVALQIPRLRGPPLHSSI